MQALGIETQQTALYRYERTSRFASLFSLPVRPDHIENLVRSAIRPYTGCPLPRIELSRGKHIVGSMRNDITRMNISVNGGLNNGTILHETAHLITLWKHADGRIRLSDGSHGAYFVTTFHELISRIWSFDFYGMQADAEARGLSVVRIGPDQIRNLLGASAQDAEGRK